MCRHGYVIEKKEFYVLDAVDLIVNAWKNVFSQVVNGTKAYLRPLSSAVISQSQTLAAQNTSSVALLPQVRCFQTSPVTRDIDSAAKFIGAGAATVGVAGSGKCRTNFILLSHFLSLHSFM